MSWCLRGDIILPVLTIAEAGRKFRSKELSPETLVESLLDRIQRGTDAEAASADPRMARIREALEVLFAAEPGRAERIQKVFSLDYDPNWKVPAPK